jgi:hypothetical protein
MRALVAAGVLLLSTVVGACGTEDDAVEAGGLPDPPKGTRWVGMNDVVVAVPDWWTTGDTRCNEPQEDTVYFDFAGTYECDMGGVQSSRDEVSSLAVLDGAHGTGEYLTRDMRTVRQASGREVKELEECNEWFPGICRRLFAVPEEGVVFAVTIDDPEDGSYEEIRDSARILPEGLTTVPLRVGDGGGYTPSWGAEPSMIDPLVDALERAGLDVEIEVAEVSDDPVGDYATLPEGSLLEISPQLGSVVEDGATVTITVSGASMAG